MRPELAGSVELPLSRSPNKRDLFLVPCGIDFGITFGHEAAVPVRVKMRFLLLDSGIAQIFSDLEGEW